MFIADAHCDLLSRRLSGKAELDVTPETLAAGGVGLQTFAAFVDMGRAREKTVDMYRRQIADFPVMAREYGLTPVCEVHKDLPLNRRYALLAVEGGEAFGGSLERAAAYVAAGMKIVTVTWNHENELAYPNGSLGGIKPFGRDMISFLESRHVGIDVSHLNQQGFWELCGRCKTLIATHSCAMPLCGHRRNLTQEQIKAIIEKKGFIGINFYPVFLSNSGKAQLSDVVAHILYMLELGGEDCVGFGSDFDGIETKPEGLENPAAFPTLIGELEKSGLTREIIDKITYKNMLRFLESL